jgi:rRNA processing protein Gar1
MTGQKRLKPGDKVAVPLGHDEIVGVVVDVYGPTSQRSAVVRVPTRGPSGETLLESDISFPESALRVVTAA